MRIVNLDAVTWGAWQPCDHEYDMQHPVALKYGRGTPMYKPKCVKCGHRGNAISAKRLDEMGIDTSTLEVVYTKACRCERGCSECSHACEWPDCGTFEMTELHHFFPKAIYGKEFAQLGTTAYFCQPHHNRWHRDVTPHLVWRDAA